VDDVKADDVSDGSGEGIVVGASVVVTDSWGWLHDADPASKHTANAILMNDLIFIMMSPG